MSSFSKYCAGVFRIPEGTTNPEAYLSDLSGIVKEVGIDLVIPMDDSDCDILIQEDSRGVGCQVALPPRESYWIARNKAKTVQFAKELGIPIPKSSLVTQPEEIESVLEDIGFPAFIKPTLSSGSRGVFYAPDRGCKDDVARILRVYGEVLVQEFVPNGGGIGVSFLMDRGLPIASFTHRRIMEFPKTGGPSIVRESVHMPDVENYARQLFESLHWHGVGMAEFRINANTRQPILMEINPRFWGSLPLAIASGVDFPRLLCDMYEFGAVPEVQSYRLGIRCVDFLPFGVASMLARGGTHNMVGVLRESCRSDCFDVESLSDPLPAFGAILSMLQSAFDRRTMDAVFHR